MLPKEQQEPEEGAFIIEEMPSQAEHDTGSQAGHDAVVQKRKLPVWAVVLIALGALLLLFIAASYLLTEQMSPILDRLLYTKEELELLRGR